MAGDTLGHAREIRAASVGLILASMVPSINLLGAFFPAWMACVLIGIALTLVSRRLLTAAAVEPWIGPKALVYPALALAFTLGTWVGFFRG
jgi:hypothetical protein